MAQTNDRKLLGKVLSKHGSRRSRNDWVDENNIPIHPETIEIIKEMGTEARLVALDDCKTLLERVDRTELYWSTELPKCFNDERISDLNKHRNAEIDFLFHAILAELEALRKKVEG